MEAIFTPTESGNGLRRLRRAGLGLVLLATTGVLGWQVAQRISGPEPAPTYVTAPAERADVAVRVTATGSLSPVVEVQVGSQLSGRVAELHADYNDTVTKGQIIARIDPQLYESAVAQAKARLAAAQATLARNQAVAENANVQYKRIADLAERGAVARAEVDKALADKRSAEAQVSASRADVTQAKSALEQAQTNLTFTTITSPIDGVVVSRSVDVGQTVAASLSAPTLFVIAEDLRKMELHTSVAESDVGQLRDGMRVEFTVDAFPGETFEGVVKQVRYEPQNVSNVVTYDAVVSVDNAELKLRPGMTATVSFIVAERIRVLAVPTRALTYRPADAPAVERAGRAGAGETHERPRRGADGTSARERRGDGETGERRANREAGAGRADRATGEGRAADDNAGDGERRARGGQRPRIVWVLRDGAPAPVRVQVGLSDGTSTEITGGDLQLGDLVITGDDRGGSARPAGGDRSTSDGNRRSGGRRGPPSIL